MTPDAEFVRVWGNRYGFDPTQMQTLWQLAGGREPSADQVEYVRGMEPAT